MSKLTTLKTVTAVLAISLGLTACSTKPIVYSPQVSLTDPNTKLGINTPNIVVKRDKGLYGSGCRVDIYLDGEKQGSVMSNSFLEITVPEDGEERILSARIGTDKSLCPNNLSELAFKASGDKIKYYRVSMTSYNTFSLTPSTNLIMK